MMHKHHKSILKKVHVTLKLHNSSLEKKYDNFCVRNRFKVKLLFIIHVIIQFSSEDYKRMSKDLSFSRSFMTTEDLKFSI